METFPNLHSTYIPSMPTAASVQQHLLMNPAKGHLPLRAPRHKKKAATNNLRNGQPGTIITASSPNQQDRRTPHILSPYSCTHVCNRPPSSFTYLSCFTSAALRKARPPSRLHCSCFLRPNTVPRVSTALHSYTEHNLPAEGGSANSGIALWIMYGWIAERWCTNSVRIFKPTHTHTRAPKVYLSILKHMHPPTNVS